MNKSPTSEEDTSTLSSPEEGNILKFSLGERKPHSSLSDGEKKDVFSLMSLRFKNQRDYMVHLFPSSFIFSSHISCLFPLISEIKLLST